MQQKSTLFETFLKFHETGHFLSYSNFQSRIRDSRTGCVSWLVDRTVTSCYVTFLFSAPAHPSAAGRGGGVYTALFKMMNVGIDLHGLICISFLWFLQKILVFFISSCFFFMFFKLFIWLRRIRFHICLTNVAKPIRFIILKIF